MITLPDPEQAPVVMGIINTTPDSFWEGSRAVESDAVLRQGERLLAEGAAILDVGGESTRPGAAPVTEAEELARVVPAVRLLVERLGAVVSVDTRRSAVAAAALAAGARLINDCERARG
jgi:dihydropteroate synthase